MATRVYLVRHGATELSSEDRFAGSIDVNLSDAGREQALRLGQRLSRDPICAVYSSPMRRTLATAEPIARPHGVEVIAVEALREISHGRWEGKTRDHVEQEFAVEFRRWEHDPYTFAPAGGESGLQVVARALPALMHLVDTNAGKPFVIVSHKATIRLLISSILGFDARAYRERLDQSPAALNILDFKDPVHARLTLFNDISHYDSDVPEVPRHRLSKVWD